MIEGNGQRREIWKGHDNGKMEWGKRMRHWGRIGRNTEGYDGNRRDREKKGIYTRRCDRGQKGRGTLKIVMVNFMMSR